MNLHTTEDIIDQIWIEEKRAAGWQERIFKHYSEIKRTSELANPIMLHLSLAEKTVIRGNRKVQVLYSLLIAALYTSIMVYVLMNVFSISFFIVIVAISLTIYYILVDNLFNKKTNFEIELTKDGILIAERFYFWSEIKDTFIVERPIGKYKKTFLVIYMNSGLIQRFNLRNLLSLSMDRKKISSLIEAYRD